MRKFKRFLKIFFISIGILLIGLLIAVHMLLKPPSDKKIKATLSEGEGTPYISERKYKNFDYRVISMQESLDTLLPTLVFVHGSPGSPLDYERYLNDSILNLKANMITYERIGYNEKNLGDVQGTLAFELKILHDVIENIPEEKIILIGYSYGGPVVLASDRHYKYKVSLASAVVGSYEPMFGLLNFYRWKLTRPIVPVMFRAAAKEKYAHLTDLPKYRDKWNISKSKVINIHGDKDFIVPYKNSEFLEDIIDSNKLSMITIKGGGHDLIWSDFDLIKKALIKTIDE